MSSTRPLSVPAIHYTEDYLSSRQGPCYGPDRRVFEFKGFKGEKESCLRVCLRQGLELCITDLNIHSPQQVSYEIRKTPFCFSFMLSGESINHIHSTSGRNRFLHVRSGSNCITCLEDITGALEFRPEKGVSCVSVYASHDLLAQYLDQAEIRSCRGLSKALAGQASRFYVDQNQMTAAMFETAYQIAHAPETLPGRKLFLEGKVLELLSLKIGQLTQGASAPGAGSPMSPKDRQCICRARDILLSRMTDPPGLNELARLSGTNEFKLKKGFKQVYGHTVFSYLRQARMEEARKLMARNAMSVSETAFQVGYSNISHFIRAYRNQYGINPGKQRRLF